MEPDRVEYIINNSNKGRNDGKQIKSASLETGKPVEFKHDDNVYRVRLLDVRNAGRWPSPAAYIAVDRRVPVDDS